MNAGSIRCERGRLAPFPFTSMFQNGPRRQGCSPENLFKPGKDSPPPRTNRAPLPAAGRSEDFPMRRERGQMQRPKHKIRSPPVDDVNNLWHHHKCQRALASTVIQIRRNALFTSPEYAPRSNLSSLLSLFVKMKRIGMNCDGLPRPSQGARSTAWTSDSRIQVFILAETARLTARRHLAGFRFSSAGETATSFFGVSERIRSISLTW